MKSKIVLIALTSILLTACASQPAQSVAPVISGAVSGTVRTVSEQSTNTINNSITWWQQFLIVFLAGVAIPDFRTICGGLLGVFGSIGKFILKLFGRL